MNQSISQTMNFITYSQCTLRMQITWVPTYSNVQCKLTTYILTATDALFFLEWDCLIVDCKCVENVEMKLHFCRDKTALLLVELGRNKTR